MSSPAGPLLKLHRYLYIVLAVNINVQVLIDMLYIFEGKNSQDSELKMLVYLITRNNG